MAILNFYESFREDPSRYNALARLYDQRRRVYKNAMAEVQRAVAEIKKKYQKGAILRIAHVDGRVKTLHSIVRKGITKGIDAKELLDVLTDIVGIRVVVSNLKDAELLIAELSNHPRLAIKATETHSDDGGYRAVHLDAVVSWLDAGGGKHAVRCEIQVRTLLQNAWAIMAHHDFYRNKASLPVLAQPISAHLSKYLQVADDLADKLRAEVQASVEPPNDLSEEATLDREGIAFLFYSMFGEKPQEYEVEYLVRKAKELAISTIGEARKGLNETTLRELSEIHCARFWFKLGTVDAFEYSLLYAVKGDKALAEFKTKTEMDYKEMQAVAHREILAEMPDTYQEFLQELEKGEVSTSVLSELGALGECIICGAEILDDYALAEAVAEHYECDVDDADILSASSYPEFQEDTQHHGLCSYCGYVMSKDD